ncbi:hypothetical protein G4Y79_08305 [Phototrophicus methaneseepsis]|uniref:STAS/SEC14 domain-containing protein n=1 Tax=Phototrophicus methaneseepsis TaxID=2710758 RepID=A0A7S8ECB8_9CHLR|nr:hypothetical protein [Phototrophicus methaneseepsis]QPC84363.1 hypothetical protein G4Y79_08305 [Phototrophicus methaneseepsis]
MTETPDAPANYTVARYEDLPVVIVRLEDTWASSDLRSMYQACVNLRYPKESHLIRITDCTRTMLSPAQSILLIQTITEQRVAGSFFDPHYEEVLVGSSLWVQMVRNRISQRLNSHIPLFPSADTALRYAVGTISRSHNKAARV